MKVKEVTAAEIEIAIRDLTVAEKTNPGIEVTIPVAYGDGELVSVIVEQAGPELIAHDAGFSAMRLSGAGVSLTPNVIRRLADFTHRYHYSFKDVRFRGFTHNLEKLN